MQLKSTTLLRNRNMENSSNQYVSLQLSCWLEIWPNLLLCPGRISNSFNFYVKLKKGTSHSDSATNTTEFLLGYGYLISQRILSITQLPSHFKFTRKCCITPFIPVYYSFRRTKCISCEGRAKKNARKNIPFHLILPRFNNSIAWWKHL